MDINSENLANNELINSNLKQVNEVVVVIVPLQAQGHLNQLLQFACLISSYGLSVYYVGLANHNHQDRVRANALKPSDIAKIHFHGLLSCPDFASGKIPTIWDACMLLRIRESIASFLHDISSKAGRVVVVHDVIMFRMFLPFIMRSPISLAAFLVSICTVVTFAQHQGCPFHLKQNNLKGCPPSKDSPYTGIKAGDIYNTSQAIEGSTYLDLMAQLASIQNKKKWAIGLILPTKLDHISNKDNICLHWLNKQPPRSFIYVSFGTSTSFYDKKIMELAMGLELSKQKFIWVLRDADVGVIFNGEARTMGLEFPEGFEEIVKGLIVREWEKCEELVTASTIENVVRKLMASEEGDVIRKRAEELGETVRRSTEKGGASRMELDSFVAHITR
ncbi:hypothetical protein K7X08_001270 [Anisodus acutangulus]|uniref:Glycosyltransferase N-terminal domain-containing protein n=1 Tax=Anisodus acutangulus TaxID=402998 RepID=A0A9Q1MNM1_9SOLA|nr:hypothetical protein K7X08_001270 [Anisodus acutangulus]